MNEARHRIKALLLQEGNEIIIKALVLLHNGDKFFQAQIVTLILRKNPGLQFRSFGHNEARYAVLNQSKRRANGVPRLIWTQVTDLIRHKR